MSTDFIDSLKKRIPYDAQEFGDQATYENKLEILIEDVQNIAFNELYPFLDSYEGIEFPKKYNNWLLRACKEYYDKEGFGGAESYSENGLSVSKKNDGILSNALMSELTPHVGVPKRSEENVTE